VPGHAYTIVNVYESFGVKLIKLRNPWGTFEWDGDWSDKSSKWSTNPGVKTSVGFMAGGTQDVDDGSFWVSILDMGSWCAISPELQRRNNQCQHNNLQPPFLWLKMSWEDFVKYFDSLDICVLSKGLNELRLNPREDCGVCGPTLGCILGCAWFWW